MNFELLNGYYTTQTQYSTPYRFIIPPAVFTNTRKVLLYYWNDRYICGFRFLNKDYDEIWRHGWIISLADTTEIPIPKDHKIIGFKVSPFSDADAPIWCNF